MARRKFKLKQGDFEMDLTPMIDVIFLLIIFFILAGRITNELRAEKITVPPTQTAEDSDDEDEWQRVIVEADGHTMQAEGNRDPINEIRVNGGEWMRQKGLGDLSAYQKLREKLDRIYDHHPYEQEGDDPSGMTLKKIIVEIRADADAEYRIVQEIMQIASDTIDPWKEMKPIQQQPSEAKPLVNIEFTTRRPDNSE